MSQVEVLRSTEPLGNEDFHCLVIQILFVNFRDYNRHGNHLFFHSLGTGKRTSSIIAKFKTQFQLNL